MERVAGGIRVPADDEVGHRVVLIDALHRVMEAKHTFAGRIITSEGRIAPAQGIELEAEFLLRFPPACIKYGYGPTDVAAMRTLQFRGRIRSEEGERRARGPSCLDSRSHSRPPTPLREIVDLLLAFRHIRTTSQRFGMKAASGGPCLYAACASAPPAGAQCRCTPVANGSLGISRRKKVIVFMKADVPTRDLLLVSGHVREVVHGDLSPFFPTTNAWTLVGTKR